MDLEIYDGNIVGVGVDSWRLSQLSPTQLETEKQTQRSANHPSNATWSRLPIIAAVRYPY